MTGKTKRKARVARKRPPVGKIPATPVWPRDDIHTKRASPLKIEEWPIARLRDYDKNPRKNDEAVGRMVTAIKEYGFRIPVVARSDGEIVDGHLRAKAARKMGLETVPVALADDLTPAQVKAFRLLANRSATWAEWDEALLKIELSDLQSLGFDMSLTGFPAAELGKLGVEGFSLEERLARADETPPAPKAPVTKLGELWQLDGHRLLAGDSTNAADVMRLLDGAKPHLMITDPPYGVSYDPGWRARAGVNLSTAKLGQVPNDDRADWQAAWELFVGDVAYVWHGALHASTVETSLLATKFAIRGQIIWAKDRFALSRGDYHWRHEPCWYAVRKGSKGHWAGDRAQSTLWEIPAREDGGHGHSTQKPVECMRRPILNNSRRGDCVYDPFLGSGTTLIAAEMEGRKCFALEIAPEYVQVCIERWETFTGKTAHREDGVTLEDLADRWVARKRCKQAMNHPEGLIRGNKPKVALSLQEHR
jgi:DNA modification methylase